MKKRMAGLLEIGTDVGGGGGSPRDAFRAAFTSAKAQIAAGETPTTDDDDEESGESETAADDEAEPVAVAETTTETETTETTTVAKDDKTVEVAEDKTGLITDDEFKALQTEHANDPVALKKSLEKAFTQKTQALAAEKKSVQRLREYEPLVDAYEADPVATLKRLAELNGVELVVPGTTTAKTTTETETETATAVADVLKDFRASLGPDLEYLADGLAPAITKLVEQLTATTVEKTVKPLREATKQTADRFATEATDKVMKTFGETHTDWKTHEAAMLQLAQKIQPNGMDELEYLEHLYQVVTRETPAQRKAAIDREVTEQVTKRVKKLATVEPETRTAATPDSQVHTRPAGDVSFRDAFKAAKAGVRFEDEDD